MLLTQDTGVVRRHSSTDESRQDSLSVILKDILWGAGKEHNNALLRLIGLTKKISLGYLKYQKLVGKGISEHKYSRVRDQEIEDLAVDCIAGLFMRDEAGQFVKLLRSFGPLLNETDSPNDIELLILLRRIVIKKTKQELTRIYGERDSLGKKFIRNIRVAAKTRKKNGEKLFSVFKNKSEEWYGFHRNGTLEADFEKDQIRAPIPDYILKGDYLELYDPSDCVWQVLEKILMVVEDHPDYRSFVPLGTVVRIMKAIQYERERLHFTDLESAMLGFNISSISDIKLIRDDALSWIEARIRKRYIATGKLTEAMAGKYLCALEDILNQMIYVEDGLVYSGKPLSAFHALKPYFKGDSSFTNRKYRSEYRTTFEYFGKLMKRRLKERTRELFAPHLKNGETLSNRDRVSSLNPMDNLPKSLHEYRSRVLNYLEWARLGGCKKCGKSKALSGNTLCLDCRYEMECSSPVYLASNQVFCFKKEA